MMKLNINIGWFITVLAIALAAGYFTSYFMERMNKQNNGNGGLTATEGGNAADEAPAVAV